jgi:tetratricopeptide (TPR) repeat protein
LKGCSESETEGADGAQTVKANMPMMNAGTTLYGREQEVDWLWKAFTGFSDLANGGSADRSPQIRVVLGESGLGKSRLVQELYNRIAQSETWNPADDSYWPRTFNDDGLHLRVTPDTTGFDPSGPPRFLWLGVRAESGNYQRSQVISDTNLGALLDQILDAARCVWARQTIWREVKRRSKRELKRLTEDNALPAIMDAVGVPVAGALVRLAKQVGEIANDRMSPPPSLHEVRSVRLQSNRERLVDYLSTLLEGEGAVPIVLWLDDAQWIDGDLLGAIVDIWERAQAGSWPLLLVATCWEREWHTMGARSTKEHADEATWLSKIVKYPDIECISLPKLPETALLSILREQLPGLTHMQRQALVEKADGNVLTMIENIGCLKRDATLFVANDASEALTEEGLEEVLQFRSERASRVEQRFFELSDEVKKVLGSSAQLGSRFLGEVVERVLATTRPTMEVRALLSECVNPLAVLGQPSSETHEFRDRLYYEIARKVGARFGSTLREDLRRIESACVREWIDNSFSEAGDYLGVRRVPKADAPIRSVYASTVGQQRLILQLALRDLSDESGRISRRLDEGYVARMLFLCVRAFSEQKDFEAIRGCRLYLDSLNWPAIATKAISVPTRYLLAVDLCEAGLLDSAVAVGDNLLGLLPGTIEGVHGDGELGGMIAGRMHLGGMYLQLGRPSEASELFEGAITAHARWRGGESDLQRKQMLRDALFAAGEARLQAKHYEQAKAHFVAGKRLATGVLEAEESDAARVAVASVACNLARLEYLLGDVDEGYRREQVALNAILNVDPEALTDHDLHAVSRVIYAHVTGQGRWERDEAYILSVWESLVVIANLLFLRLGTPRMKDELANALQDLAKAKMDAKLESDAYDHMLQCVQLSEELTDYPSPGRAKELLSVRLDNLAIVEYRLNMLDEALEHLRRSRDLRVAMIQDGETSVDREALERCCKYIADLEFLIEQRGAPN